VCSGKAWGLRTPHSCIISGLQLFIGWKSVVVSGPFSLGRSDGAADHRQRDGLFEGLMWNSIVVGFGARGVVQGGPYKGHTERLVDLASRSDPGKAKSHLRSGI